MQEPAPDATDTAELVVGPGARVLQPGWDAGQRAGGVGVDGPPTAPTPPGATVKAVARYVGREGKLFLFEVVASDAGGEIGRARHRRAVVDAERLQASAARRVAAGNG